MRIRDAWLMLIPLAVSLATTPALGDAFNAHLDSMLYARSPVADSLFRAANEARESNRHHEAWELYGRVSRTVPDFGASQRRQAGELLEMGNRLAALIPLNDLIRRDPDPLNELATADALITRTGSDEPSKEELREARVLLLRLMNKAPDEAFLWQLVAQVGFMTEDMALARQGVDGLERLAPGDLHSWLVRSMYESGQGRMDSARSALNRASS